MAPATLSPSGSSRWLPSPGAADKEGIDCACQTAPSLLNLLRWLCACLGAISAAAVRPCTTVFLQNGETRLVGNNYDYYAVDGRVIVNRRGLRKPAFETNSGLQWVARFGSVAIEQWGHELPNGGMNEAGLVLGQMMLDSTQFPSNNDPRPSLVELQWIQYQLDCSASVEDVLASDARIRISQNSTPIHFLVADAAGHAAAIEFLGGRMVAHTGATLPIPALTNDTYDSSVAYAAVTRPENASHVTSLGRFVQAAASAASFAQAAVPDPVAFAFATLDNVNQPNWTRWNTVYDIGRRRVYFRTQIARGIKEIDLADVDFRPGAETRMVDINIATPGLVIPDRVYTRADNLAVLVSVYRQTTPWSFVSLSYLQQRASYPDLVRVEPYSPALLTQPDSQTVSAGGDVVFSTAAAGEPSSLTYTWRRDGVPISGATDATLTLVGVGPADAADYTVDVTNALGSVTSRFARLTVAAPEPGRLVNMSVRAPAGLDGQPLIVGLVASGGSKRMLVRAIGPSLASLFGIEGALADPRLEVHQTINGQDCVVATNDDWGANPVDCEALGKAFGCVGAFPIPSTSRDAAVMLEVDGARTFHACPARESGPGVALVEAYDAGTGNSPRLVNLSTRNHVGTGANVLVAGFVINGNVPKRLLVRGVGPSLGPLFGVTGALADPVLELHTKIDGRDTIVARNDDWADEPGANAAATAVGAFPLPGGSKDAVLVVTVPPGLYSAVLSGAGNLTGQGLIEVYERGAEGGSSE